MDDVLASGELQNNVRYSVRSYSQPSADLPQATCAAVPASPPDVVAPGLETNMPSCTRCGLRVSASTETFKTGAPGGCASRSSCNNFNSNFVSVVGTGSFTTRMNTLPELLHPELRFRAQIGRPLRWSGTASCRSTFSIWPTRPRCSCTETRGRRPGCEPDCHVLPGPTWCLPRRAGALIIS